MARAWLTDSWRPPLVDGALDLLDGGTQLMLALRFQRNIATKLSGNPMIVLEAIQIISVPGIAEAAAIAGHILQGFRRVLGCLVGCLHFRLIDKSSGIQCCRPGTLRPGWQYHPIFQSRCDYGLHGRIGVIRRASRAYRRITANEHPGRCHRCYHDDGQEQLPYLGFLLSARRFSLDMTGF